MVNSRAVLVNGAGMAGDSFQPLLTGVNGMAMLKNGAADDHDEG